MGVFCDRLKLGSTTALDCRTGQNKADIAKKSSHFYLSRCTRAYKPKSEKPIFLSWPPMHLAPGVILRGPKYAQKPWEGSKVPPVSEMGHYFKGKPVYTRFASLLYFWLTTWLIYMDFLSKHTLTFCLSCLLNLFGSGNVLPKNIWDSLQTKNHLSCKQNQTLPP